MCSPTNNYCGPGNQSNCMCGCGGRGHFLSKKKQVEHLNEYRDCLKDKLADIEEYIKEIS